MMLWSLLILTLPSQGTTARMRAWRGLKAAGAAVLRDGVYLIPAAAPSRATLVEVAEDVQKHQGSAQVLDTEAPAEQFAALFDRSAEWQALRDGCVSLHDQLASMAWHEALRQQRKLHRQCDSLLHIDFFPGVASQEAAQARTALDEAMTALLARSQAADEPGTGAHDVPLRQVSDYQHRCWATRARPWVDRLACAWLIQRFIDRQARFLWLATPQECPADALGFDFDGATFSHGPDRVSFETLLLSFGLNHPGLARLAALVHAVDLGRPLPPEAAGVTQVLAGWRHTISDDDRLLAQACALFDGLLTSYTLEP
jgi:hypothetical protein